MSRISRLDYAYAVGQVRALEKNLISKPAFSEAAGEKDFPSTLKIIFDEGQFHQEKIEIQNSEHLDEFLYREKSELHALISNILIEKGIENIIRGVDQPDKVLSLSRALEYPFITDYLRHKIDLANLKIFCRAKYLELPYEKMERLLLQGGFVDVSVLLGGFDLSFGEIGERLHASGYQSVWIQATDDLVEKETFVALEREFENFLMGYLKKAKFIVFGPEPVFAYAQAKKKELQLVRLLGVGKLNQIPPEALKDRISETYV